MKSYVTSYNGLFARGAEAGAPVVERIEIPIIQRDYAQGRESGAVPRIRANFLDALHQAVTTDEPISLDFVYGDVADGTLRPFDGQQRLTTLFLLHWYLAWRAGELEKEQGWKRFEYATRPSARRFCACLVQSKPPPNAPLRAWIEDQHWFLHTWSHDPTIQSMLVMIEAIHERFGGADCSRAWARLVDPHAPAVSFHLLPIEQMRLTDDLYIKMNSRGKPLTEFESFKARFEQLLERSCPHHVEAFARKVDGAWADLLWPFRGSDDIVDDELLHYFHFVTDLCAWQEGRRPEADLDVLAERVYGPENERAAANLELLFRSFDTWIGADTKAEFSKLFSLASSPPDSDDTSKVVLFGVQGSSVDLFAECCQGELRRSRPRTLLLYAVLLHRLHETPELPRRLRVLRNLIEASGSELRAESMPSLLADVRKLIIEGVISGISTFNQAQVADEQAKAELLREAPALERAMFHLEDHPLLRGCLAAFDLDASVFEPRARAFHEVFADPTLLLSFSGAMLAAGDYSKRLNNRSLQLGSSSEMSQWRDEIFTGSGRAQRATVRAALGRVLDAVAAREGDVRSALESFAKGWSAEVERGEHLDWRWYLVRYPEMRSGRSGIYASATGTLGYNLCMLDKRSMSSYYRDPYLSAVRRESGAGEAVRGAVHSWSGGPWFTGYETQPRWMQLIKSGAEIQCVRDGFQLRAPSDPHLEAFHRVCADHGVGPDLLRLSVPQVGAVDKTDRVKLAAALLRDLVAAGM